MAQLKWLSGLFLLVLLIWHSNTQEPATAGTENSTYLPIIYSPPSEENQLPNPSFEEGWYHPNGIPELQVPEGWQFAYEEGENPLDPAKWNRWVPPELRVLPSTFLPAHEHELFIWDGDQTVKVFKGSGSISFELTTAVTLTPGTYKLTINLFPDLYTGFSNGQKVWATHPYSGEVKLIAGNGTTDWLLPAFGEQNSFSTTFTITQTETVTVGAAMRGRWAIANNGWFMDDWSLYQQ